MNASQLQLRNAPIVEAVLDIDCDLPATFDLAALQEPARELFRDRYSKSRKLLMQEVQIAAPAPSPPQPPPGAIVQALRFLQQDEKQLVQVRAQGFSFNRLAPYSNLDEYLPEIERTWRLYVDLASPIETRLVRLQYINRILLPLEAGEVELDDYLKIRPRLADEETMKFTGFFVQHTAVEKHTGYQVNVVLAAQAPENEKLPVIFDNGVASVLKEEPGNWPAIRQTIDSLRRLKNRVFLNTLTDKCVRMFR